MKKGILLLLGLMTIATIKADDVIKPSSKIGVNYNYSDAVSFVERGVQFHVFLNGDFDFNTHYRDTRYVDYYRKRSKIRRNRGVRIERDYRGRIRRIGNTFINYDHRGNVKRIGSVFIGYRFGQLARVGNLRVKYDRWGDPHFYGNVKYNDFYDDGFRFNVGVNLGGIFDYNDAYFYRKDFRRNYHKFKEDRNFFYYRAKPNAKIGKRNKILKRRKPTKGVSKKSKIKKEEKVVRKRRR